MAGEHTAAPLPLRELSSPLRTPNHAARLRLLSLPLRVFPTLTHCRVLLLRGHGFNFYLHAGTPGEINQVKASKMRNFDIFFKNYTQQGKVSPVSSPASMAHFSASVSSGRGEHLNLPVTVLSCPGAQYTVRMS